MFKTFNYSAAEFWWQIKSYQHLGNTACLDTRRIANYATRNTDSSLYAMAIQCSHRFEFNVKDLAIEQ